MWFFFSNSFIYIITQPFFASSSCSFCSIASLLVVFSIMFECRVYFWRIRFVSMCDSDIDLFNWRFAPVILPMARVCSIVVCGSIAVFWVYRYIKIYDKIKKTLFLYYILLTFFTRLVMPSAPRLNCIWGCRAPSGGIIGIDSCCMTKRSNRFTWGCNIIINGR